MAYTLEDAKKKLEKDEQDYRNFETYKPTQFQLSQDATNMWNQITNWNHPTWDRNNSTYWGKVNDTMNAIENRQPFTYDLNGDMLYQQYKNQYTHLGDLAMRDTMGQAAALTGGYGNSYAQTVGQQTYQGYLQQLNDKIPELYQLALDQYNREGEDLYNKLSAYGNLYNTEYGEHRDSVTDSYNNLSQLTNLYGIKSDEEFRNWSTMEELNADANRMALEKLATTYGLSAEQVSALVDADLKSRQIAASTSKGTGTSEINSLVNELKSAQKKGDDTLYKYIANLSGYDDSVVLAALDSAGIPRSFVLDYEEDLVKKRLAGEVAGGKVGDSQYTDTWYKDMVKKYNKVK